MMVGEKRDMKPFLLKFGVALALTFAGYLYSRLRTRRNKSSGRPSGGGAQASSSCNTVSHEHILDTEETCTDKVIINNSSSDLSPSVKHYGENDELLLPEFNDLGKEVDFGNSFKKDAKTLSPKAYASPEKDDYEQEIRHLRNMIRVLQERERSLEVQLLEYCGLREQETAVMELQNRLKISNMEAKMFKLKVESLQYENWRLEAQVVDHGKVMAELEAAKAKVKLLNKKIRYEAEQNREQIINFQQRVAKLQDQDSNAAVSDGDITARLQTLKDLESEAEELRKSNLRLERDNSDLARRLNSTQILANAVLEDPEVDALKEESEHLRQENEGLVREIERLQADRYSDVEELVYLQWINACLRYELRNYQAPPGKTVARDLSRSLSPSSEKKAKQLILEYAYTDGGVSIVDLDSDQWFSSQASFLTDSGEGDDYSSVDNSSATRNNSSSMAKVLRKLRELIRSKDNHHHHNQGSSGEKYESQEDNNSPHFSSSVSIGNDAGAEGQRREFAAPTSTSRTSSDFHRLTSLKDKDRKDTDSSGVGSSKIFRRIRGGSVDLKNRHDSFPDSLGVEKSELVKYAEALKDSGGSEARKLRRRSYSSF